MAERFISGINHVALVTSDLDRFVAFYGEVFGAAVVTTMADEHGRHALVDIGGGSMLHAVEQSANPHAQGSSTLLDRGHLDHLALAARDVESFEALRGELMRREATDGVVTDFGVGRSVYFEDPDGMGCEVMLMLRELRPDDIPHIVAERAQAQTQRSA
jgi:catechol 2,3-dioxygenase-like lactoylglutathione lyase family enzyme